MKDRFTLRRIKGQWPRVLRNGRPTGFYLNEGSFSGTSDDRAGRWYVQREASAFSDKRGPGARTQALAIDQVREIVELEALERETRYGHPNHN